MMPLCTFNHSCVLLLGLDARLLVTKYCVVQMCSVMEVRLEVTHNVSFHLQFPSKVLLKQS